MNRRQVLLTTAAAGLVLAAGATGWVLTRDPAKAREPWRTAGEARDDSRLRWLSYAILAPNPHNMQPWLIRLDGADNVVITADLGRLLPQTDPFDRQIVIGFGAFLELLRMAAAEDGVRAEITPFPEGEAQPRLDQRPIAAVRLIPDPSVTPDPLFKAVLDRRTNRLPYDLARPVPAADLEAIGKVGPGVATTADPALVASLRDLTVRAFEVEARDPPVWKESVDVIRIGKSAIDANPDGIALAGPLLEGLGVVGLLSPEAMLDPASSGFRQSLDSQLGALATGMAYVWSTTPGNSRVDQLDSGAIWLRAQLQATALGIAFQPASQALQEYPSMRPLFEEMRGLLGVPADKTLQLLARLGYAAPVPPAPRWPLDSKLVPA